MPRYNVTLPIAGYAIIEVEASGPQAAIGEALEAVDFSNIEEWNAYRVLVEGNVFRGPCNKADVEEVDGE